MDLQELKDKYNYDDIQKKERKLVAHHNHHHFYHI